MFLARSRSLFFLAFLASCLVLGAALYIERSVGLLPCSLCLLQRLFVAMFGGICLLASLHAPGTWGARVYAGVALLMALAGAWAATRQVWLQGSSAVTDMGCHASVSHLAQSRPWDEVFGAMFVGAPDCAQINWSLLDLTLPEWSLLAFAGMALFCLLQLFVRDRSPRRLLG